MEKEHVFLWSRRKRRRKRRKILGDGKHFSAEVKEKEEKYNEEGKIGAGRLNG